MESNFLQSVFGKNDFEMRTDILWRKNIPDAKSKSVQELRIIFIIYVQELHIFVAISKKSAIIAVGV